MPHQKRIAALAGIILLVFIFSPILFAGFSDIKQGEMAWQAKEFSRAEEYYLHAVQIFPWRKDLWEKAGLAASANADYEAAVLYLLRAPKLSEQGWTALGFSYINLGDIPSALETYQQGLIHHESPSLYAGLAFVYRQQKNWSAESEVLKEQSRLDAGDVYAHYRLGLLLAILEPESSLPELMLAASLDPETDPAVQTLRAALNLSARQAEPSQQMLTIGRALGLVEEWELAVSAFDKAIVSDPENAEAWAWLGEAKQQTGQDGSVELDQAVAIGHSSVVVHALRGQYWNRQEEYSRMLVEYQQAAELEPDNPAWQVELGNAYSKMGDLVSAFSSYQHATDLAPHESTYWRLLAVFCAENGVLIEEAGLPAAQKAVELSPNDPFALDALGWSYLSSGRYTNAEQVLLDGIAQYPDYLPSHIHLAMTYLAQGNRSAAINELTFVRNADAGGSDGLLAEELLAMYFPK